MEALNSDAHTNTLTLYCVCTNSCQYHLVCIVLWFFSVQKFECIITALCIHIYFTKNDWMRLGWCGGSGCWGCATLCDTIRLCSYKSIVLPWPLLLFAFDIKFHLAFEPIWMKRYLWNFYVKIHTDINIE